MTVAVPTVVLETVAAFVDKSVGVSACNWVLSVPRLVPSAPRVVLCLLRLVSSVWRFVMGMLSAAMIDWIIDETFNPLKEPPIVTLINRRYPIYRYDCPPLERKAGSKTEVSLLKAGSAGRLPFTNALAGNKTVYGTYLPTLC